ncbi:MAG: hypothetical protein LRY69_07890 [Gammaproteobacteria bacterium]|nr:hypothetical protein [Gammaproteobacteria bacterium]
MFNSPSMIIDSFRPHTGSGSYFYFQDPSSNECYRLKIETEYPNDGIFGLETVSLNNVLFDGIVFDLASSLKEHAKYYVFIQECEHIHHEAVSRPIAALDHHEFVSRQITARQIAARHMSGTYHNSLVYQIGQEMPNGQAIRTFNYLTRLNDSRSSTIVKSYAALLVPEQDLTLLISKLMKQKIKQRYQKNRVLQVLSKESQRLIKKQGQHQSFEQARQLSNLKAITQ